MSDHDYNQSPGGAGNSPVRAPSPAGAPGLLHPIEVAEKLRLILTADDMRSFAEDASYRLGYMRSFLENWAYTLDPRPVATAATRATGRVTKDGGVS